MLVRGGQTTREIDLAAQACGFATQVFQARIFLGDRFGGRIGDVLHWAERSETILLVVAGALIAYFVLESVLVHAGKWRPTAPFVRWATGWKIAAIVGTVLLLLYLEVWMRAGGVSFRRLRGL